MLTSRVTKQVDIPHEPGEWLTIRMLPGKKLDEAREERERAVFGKLRALGGEVLRETQGMSRREAREVLEADPLEQYDIDVLLRAGIVGWSYEERFSPTVTEDLDEYTRRWAAEEILAFSRQTIDEEARKNS